VSAHPSQGVERLRGFPTSLPEASKRVVVGFNLRRTLLPLGRHAFLGRSSSNNTHFRSGREASNMAARLGVAFHQGDRGSTFRLGRTGRPHHAFGGNEAQFRQQM